MIYREKKIKTNDFLLVFKQIVQGVEIGYFQEKFVFPLNSLQICYLMVVVLCKFTFGGKFLEKDKKKKIKNVQKSTFRCILAYEQILRLPYGLSKSIVLCYRS